MEDVNEMLAEQQRELERIRRKRGHSSDTGRIRNILNFLFLATAAVGLVLYFYLPEKHIYGLGTIAIGMLFKTIELFVRFML